MGSYEQHGPHLPPNTDYLLAKKITESLVFSFSGEMVDGIKIGISTEHYDFKETKSISKEQFITNIEKIIDRDGMNSKFIFINAHGGNNQALNIIEQKYPYNSIVFNTFSLIKEDLNEIRTSELGGICHGGEFETSMMLYLFPDLVKMNRLKREDIVYVPVLDPNSKKKKIKNWQTINFSKSGILGDPYHATKDKGKKWFESLLRTMTQSIKKKIKENFY